MSKIKKLYDKIVKKEDHNDYIEYFTVMRNKLELMHATQSQRVMGEKHERAMKALRICINILNQQIENADKEDDYFAYVESIYGKPHFTVDGEGFTFIYYELNGVCYSADSIYKKTDAYRKMLEETSNRNYELLWKLHSIYARSWWS